MAAEIGPGTPVIFIGPDDGRRTWMGRSGLTLGALYFVKAVEEGSLPCGSCGSKACYSLRGDPGRFRIYGACAFRPLGDDGEAVEVTAEVETPTLETADA